MDIYNEGKSVCCLVLHKRHDVVSKYYTVSIITATIRGLLLKATIFASVKKLCCTLNIQHHRPNGMRRRVQDLDKTVGQ